MEIILGTANFDQKYGILDSSTKLAQAEIDDVLSAAQELGVNDFDLALGYGEVEKNISKGTNLTNDKKFTTKVGKTILSDFDGLRYELESRIEILGIESFNNILLHDPELLNDVQALRNLEELRNAGLTKHIGASIYENFELSRFLEMSGTLSVLQLPYNLLSKDRFEISKLTDLASMGIYIQVRSVFLQGVLLNPLDGFSNKLEGMRPVLDEFHELCLAMNLSPINLLVGFIESQPWCHGLVVGVNSANQLREIFESSKNNLGVDFSIFPNIDVWHQDPRNWGNK
jgi:aryl-alcohol dehydrogenase-like predicted oxidoreductase